MTTTFDPVSAGALPYVSVVIPTFNRLADLRRTMEALFTQSLPAVAVEIIVVDNSSTDGTQEWVQSLTAGGHTNVRYLRKAPEGPAAARNTGIRHAGTEFTLFIDSDVVLDREWIASALDAMRSDPALACVGGVVVYAHSTLRLNCFGGDMGPIGLAWDHAEGHPLSEASAPRDCLWFNCSAMMVRTEIVRRLGAFDPVYFYGYEDSDLGWRVNVAGHRVRVIPALVATHHIDPKVGASDPKIVFHYTKNRLRSLIKNYGLARLCTYGTASFSITLLDSLIRSPRAPKLQAVVWNIVNIESTLRERRNVQASRRVGDGQLIHLFERAWFPPTRLAGRRRRPAEGSDADMRGAAPARDDRVH